MKAFRLFIVKQWDRQRRDFCCILRNGQLNKIIYTCNKEGSYFLYNLFNFLFSTVFVFLVW